MVDGNKVTNSVNGLYMGNQAWDTVLRNNLFEGNKHNEVNVADGVSNQMLTSGRGAPGVEPLALIGKDK